MKIITRLHTSSEWGICNDKEGWRMQSTRMAVLKGFSDQGGKDSNFLGYGAGRGFCCERELREEGRYALMDSTFSYV